MEKIPFTLASPEKVLFDQEATMVVIPGLDGDIGVLPQHAPLLTLLRPGVVAIYEGEKVMVRIFVDGGFAEVTPERCMALVSEATPVEALDKASLELEIKNLLEDLEDSKSMEERLEADRSLEVARAKLMEVISAK